MLPMVLTLQEYLMGSILLSIPSIHCQVVNNTKVKSQWKLLTQISKGSQQILKRKNFFFINLIGTLSLKQSDKEHKFMELHKYKQRMGLEFSITYHLKRSLERAM